MSFFFCWYMYKYGTGIIWLILKSWMVFGVLETIPNLRVWIQWDISCTGTVIPQPLNTSKGNVQCKLYVDFGNKNTLVGLVSFRPQQKLQFYLSNHNNAFLIYLIKHLQIMKVHVQWWLLSSKGWGIIVALTLLWAVPYNIHKNYKIHCENTFRAKFWCL